MFDQVAISHSFPYVPPGNITLVRTRRRIALSTKAATATWAERVTAIAQLAFTLDALVRFNPRSRKPYRAKLALD